MPWRGEPACAQRINNLSRQPGSAGEAEPDNLRALTTVSDTPAGRAESAFRDTPARSPSVAIADQARSHGSGSYQVDAHDPVAGGRDSAAAASRNNGVVLPGWRRPPDGSRCR